MKLKQETLARLFAAGLFVGLLVPIGLFRLGINLAGPAAGQSPSIELHGRMPESGGWLPADLEARVGTPLRLRLTSNDVVHSFAVGQTDWPVIQVEPGKFTETELVFERPGKYIYYCTRWCGPNHWRMRGVIQVSGPGEVPQAGLPLYLELGLDLDAPHPAAAVPESAPSAAAGQHWLMSVPERYKTGEYYASHSPSAAFLALRSEPALAGLPDQSIWDLTAALWGTNATPAALETGRELYDQNCAACHGEAGRGDGVMVRYLEAQPGAGEEAGHSAGAGTGHAGEGPSFSGHEIIAPVDFTDPAAMLGASPALLHGKIVRGGMGTGMPYWGPVFTDEQVWALTAYLWTFTLNLESDQ